MGWLALAGLACTGADRALAHDPPPSEPGGLAFPASGTFLGVPEEHEVEVWTGHLGGDCTPKRLSTTQVVEPRCGIQTSADGSTLAYLTSSGVSFERRDGFKMSRAGLEGGFHRRLASPAELVLSGNGRRAAYVTHEGASDLLRTTLWTLDLGAKDGPGSLPAKALKPARIKRSAPGVNVHPVGWSPSGESLIYLEQTRVRGDFVSVLVARDVRAQTESELERCFGQIDFVLPFQSGASAGAYRVLVAHRERLRWVYPNGAPDEVLEGPDGIPLISEGIAEVWANPRRPLEVAIRMGWATLRKDGKEQSGVYRIRGDQVQQISSARDSTTLRYGPEGTLSLTDSSSVTLFGAKTQSTLAFADPDQASPTIRASDWHSSQPMLAMAFDDTILVLDLRGDLPDDAEQRFGWSQFVGLRAPGHPKPTLHRALRLKSDSKQRIAKVLWHGDRLVWTLEKRKRLRLTR